MSIKDRKRIELSDKTLAAIRAHALKEYPNEACGLILKSGKYHACTNQHPEPSKNFTISALEYAKYISKVEAVVHTHIPERRAIIDPRTPSLADLSAQKKTGLPWLIFSCDGSDISAPVQFPRVHEPNLTHRPFIPHIADCYSLVQDAYLSWYDIELKDGVEYTEDDIFKGVLTFDAIHKDFDFLEVNPSDLKDGDLCVISTTGTRRNHLGIFKEGRVYHQHEISVDEDVNVFAGRIITAYRHKSNASNNTNKRRTKRIRSSGE